MKLRKAIATLLAAVMSFAAVGIQTVSAAGLSGMPQDWPDSVWSKEAAEAAVANGLIQGIDGHFRPANNTPRSQIATIVNRAFGAAEMADISGVTDVPAGAWYAAEMAKAVKMGTMNITNGTLTPEVNATREQVFAILGRAFVVGEAPNANALARFTDQNDVSSWARNELAAMVEAGYVRGANGRLNPKSPITREEFASVMHEMVKQYIRQPGEYTEVAEGNVMITASPVTLKDVDIKGDLIIGDAVKEGVTLENVNVSGRLLIRSGDRSAVEDTDCTFGSEVLFTPPAVPSAPSQPSQPGTQQPGQSQSGTGGLSGGGSSGGGVTTGSISFNVGNQTLYLNGTNYTEVVATVSGLTNRNVTWSQSGNNGIASVRFDGNVAFIEGLKAGSFTLTATSIGNTSLYRSITITVAEGTGGVTGITFSNNVVNGVLTLNTATNNTAEVTATVTGSTFDIWDYAAAAPYASFNATGNKLTITATAATPSAGATIRAYAQDGTSATFTLRITAPVNQHGDVIITRILDLSNMSPNLVTLEATIYGVDTYEDAQNWNIEYTRGTGRKYTFDKPNPGSNVFSLIGIYGEHGLEDSAKALYAAQCEATEDKAIEITAANITIASAGPDFDKSVYVRNIDGLTVDNYASYDVMFDRDGDGVAEEVIAPSVSTGELIYTVRNVNMPVASSDPTAAAVLADLFTVVKK